MSPIIKQKINFVFRRFCIVVLILFCGNVFAQDKEGFRKEIKVLIDNDALLFGEPSDRYYSFGMGIDLAFKREKLLGLQNLFSNKQNYFFSVQLKSEGHTPSYQVVDNLNPQNNQFDRPFAGVLYGQFNGVYTFENSIFKSGVLFGVMGPSSFAKDIQWWYHTKIANEITFSGWDYQVPSQFVYNLDARYIHDVTSSNKWFSVFGGLEGRIGGLHTDLTPMIGIRLGKLDKFTESIGMGNGILSNRKRIYLYLQSEIKTTLTFFNGTAQGNLFNDDYLYRVDDLSRVHLTLVQSVYGAYKGVTLGFSYYYTEDRVLSFAEHHYGSVMVFYAW